MKLEFRVIGLVVLIMFSILFFTYMAEAQFCPYVPYFSQLDPRWAKNQLGTCSGVTIGSAGCVIACTSMVFKYYDRNLDIDPGKLNELLKRDKGYVNGCEMLWSAPLRYTKNLILESIAYTNKLSDIDQYLFRFEPPIVKVSYKGLPHYVVVTYKYKGTYYIHDPNKSGATLDYYNNMISSYIVYSLTYCRSGAPPKSNGGSIATTWGSTKQ